MSHSLIARFVIALLLAAAGYSARGVIHQAAPPDVVLDTSYELLRARLEEERATSSGLRAALAGRSALPPDTVYVTDTLVSPPDTVFEFVSVSSSGALTTSRLIASPEGVGLYAPSIAVHSVGSCDDGFQVNSQGVVCDRARLGHLYLGVGVFQSPYAAVWWRPAYRSPWELVVAYDGAFRLGVRWGLQLF